jgi:cysteine desulfurase family protein
VSRLYLDHAATSYPKPEVVWKAVEHYQRHLGTAVGRGGYDSSQRVGHLVQRARYRLAELFRAESPERISFGFNGTDVLNQALHGLLRPGDRVVTTQLEHNSVIRPLQDLRQRLGIELIRVPATPQGSLDIDAFRVALECRPRLVAMLHASNVSGAILPLADLAALARQAGALVLVDAAQTAGHVPIDLGTLPIDLLACSGHKGLLGPLGTGVLYLRPGIEEQLRACRQGGTGTASEAEEQPTTLPEKLEAGNHNAPGLCGLDAGVGWVLERSPHWLHRHERELTEQLSEGLRHLPGMTLYGPAGDQDRVGVLSLTLCGWDPQELATTLDQSFGIEVRAGLHCAPGIHRALGTLSGGGTVRISVGPFTTPTDIEAVIAALSQIAGA